MENVPWWERNWLNLLTIFLKFILVAIFTFIPCMQEVAVLLLCSAIFQIVGMAMNDLCPAGSKVLDGIGTLLNGMGAVSTGLALFSLGPVGMIAGVLCILIGGATMVIGLNEAIYGATGENVVRKRTGMSQDTYDAIYLGLNIASAVCTTVGSAYGSLRGINCFIAGTLVQTEDGLKPIEQIEVGDKVLAYDEQTGEQGYKAVKQLFRNTTNNWCTVIVKPENSQETFEIVSTPGHKYYLPDNIVNRDLGKRLEHIGYAGLSKKWVSAESLKNGDKVLLSDGSYGIIQSVNVEKLQTPETTYNFEVEDYHTYYVSESKILVHNACPEEFEWGKGSFDSSEESLAYHTKIHGEGVGVAKTDTNGYLKKAKNFAAEVVNRNVRPSGYVNGMTPNVKRFNYKGKYIDLDKANKIIVSFGRATKR